MVHASFCSFLSSIFLFLQNPSLSETFEKTFVEQKGWQNRSNRHIIQWKPLSRARFWCHITAHTGSMEHGIRTAVPFLVSVLVCDKSLHKLFHVSYPLHSPPAPLLPGTPLTHICLLPPRCCGITSVSLTTSPLIANHLGSNPASLGTHCVFQCSLFSVPQSMSASGFNVTEDLRLECRGSVGRSLQDLIGMYRLCSETSGLKGENQDASLFHKRCLLCCEAGNLSIQMWEHMIWLWMERILSGNYSLEN